MPYIMTTTRGNRYELDDKGAVTARSNGPEGWDYSGAWIIKGASTRHHSRHIVPLEDIARDGVPGHGVIHDLDHGTHRSWGMERMVRLTRA